MPFTNFQPLKITKAAFHTFLRSHDNVIIPRAFYILRATSTDNITVKSCRQKQIIEYMFEFLNMHWFQAHEHTVIF